ncbi:fumarylacetoacetate hydrolase family protein [Pikeienuella piscinae]|uniref:Fumarylacetoacetate hydrolase family protein n=1 Tax=Pikeienuella piscinae TaxID=2748098 RepID=A0A7L5BVJ8_9RHOB|nr:fumarylacetoacetate hydrolase family protein [Pikeienuella piscinae]QIE54838.1 fumarylacetoacetate hydrolase family protein [Pikeienuella piscinae]
MKYCRYECGGGARIGAVVEGGVADLTVRRGFRTMTDLIAAGAPGVLPATPDHDARAISFDQPMPEARRIFCIGVNYMNRNEEYKDGSDAPAHPSIFARSPLSFTGPDKPLIRPSESEQLDYEGEIVLVVGKPGRRIPQAEAMNHVFGLTLMNEGTIRDWVRHGKFNVTQGKNWDRSGAIGPWVETGLDRLDVTDLRIETRVNGELRQSDSTASMAFPFAKIIEYISTFTEIGPGDLIATGTPTGAGARLDPPVWLKPGDVVEVSAPGIGVLRNGVADE